VEQLEPRLLLDATVMGSERLARLEVSLAVPAVFVDLNQEHETVPTYESLTTIELAPSDGASLAQMEESGISTPGDPGEQTLVERSLNEATQSVQLEPGASQSLAGALMTQVESGAQMETGSYVFAEASQNESSSSVVAEQETIIVDSNVSPTAIRGPPADAQVSSISIGTTSQYSGESGDFLLSGAALDGQDLITSEATAGLFADNRSDSDVRDFLDWRGDSAIDSADPGFFVAPDSAEVVSPWQLVEFDYATRTQRVLSLEDSLGVLLEAGINVGGQEVSGFEGIRDYLQPLLVPEGTSGTESSAGLDSIQPNFIFGQDWRERVPHDDLLTYPWSAQGRIWGTFPGLGEYSASGTMISPDFFITAGHCVNLGGGGSWASQLVFSPGQDWEKIFENGTDFRRSEYQYWGEAQAVALYSWAGWTAYGNWDWDMALVRTDRNIGDFTGWLGYGYTTDDAWYFRDGNLAGYPGDLTPLEYDQWSQSDNARNYGVTPYQLRSETMDIWGGQSGSGLYYTYDPGSGLGQYVHGVTSHGTYTDSNGNGRWDPGEPTYYNAFTRMTEATFNQISSLIANEPTPIDRPDLLDYDKWFKTTFAYFTAGPLRPGDTLTVRSVVRNNGTAAAGSFKVTFYASANNTIETSDYRLGDAVISSLAPFSWTDAIWTGTLPDMPAGNYYIGWIIDSEAAQTELVETNNVGMITGTRLAVESWVPDVTVLGSNGISITDGDTSPWLMDGTDFGSVRVGDSAVLRTYTVRNDGTPILTLGPVSVPEGFTLVEGLSSSLAWGASDAFTVRLDTATAGTKSGDISFTTNDPDENPFNFRITGTVLPPLPEVAVLGNGALIADGDTTPSLSDYTDFGSVVQGGVAMTRVFTVRNDGTATLTLGVVTVPSGFTLIEDLSASLAPGASDTFTVQLDTAIAGTKTGDLSFSNNDPDENPFNFRITGVVTGATAPEVTVQGNGVSISDGDTTPSTTDGTDFGSVAQGGSPISRTFTVRNDGTGTLTLGAVTVPTGFTLTEGLSASLAPGASDTFTVRLETATAGTRSGTISFATNDSDENPFDFAITGVVTGGTGGSVPAEQFLGGADSFDLANKAILFSPGGSGYTFTTRSITALPTEPSGSTVLSLGDDEAVRVTVGSGRMVVLCGQSYGSLYVGSNGYLTFTQADADYSETLADHFDTPRVSVLFDDLNAGSAGAVVSWIQWSDRMVVTWQRVVEFDTGSVNTMQVEMYFDGGIQLAWLTVGARDGIVGLSNGAGLPGDFTETDFSRLGSA
jgi:V8-like Glu-specific endopeptidase